MIKAPMSVGAVDIEVEEAARLIKEHKIGGCRFWRATAGGVITMLDLIGAFLTHAEPDPDRLAPGSLPQRTNPGPGGGRQDHQRCRRQDPQSGPGTRTGATGRAYYFRLERCDLGPIVEALNKAGIKVLEVIP